MGKIKLKISVIALVAMLVTMMSQATLAYYTTVGKATNVVTSGNFRFIIHETSGNGSELPEEGVYIVPGDIVSKAVSIESDCDNPFYLRVRIVYGINSEVLPADDCFKLNINTDYWELHDGWYYYKEEVPPGEMTADVFSHIEIVGSKVDNSYIGKTLTLTVDAQAVQSEHNPLTDGKIYTASGWPAE